MNRDPVDRCDHEGIFGQRCQRVRGHDGAHSEYIGSLYENRNVVQLTELGHVIYSPAIGRLIAAVRARCQEAIEGAEPRERALEEALKLVDDEAKRLGARA